jgi:hypothetical protein
VRDYLDCRLAEVGLKGNFHLWPVRAKIYNPLILPYVTLATISEEDLTRMNKEEVDLFVLDLELKKTFET